ncbi:coproporphyrinogen dehydrogenase HemZ [Tindallia californiensis]|uniref:Oxygen-independent coproporphyrinogen-3 oxidase n=1 Tax=Tindallia californiensis TaxID=159292 RepID=A0A1H3NFL9_9FIRM|nr:coproporphyrinogen dehydrogenase HemZ [Tindallia californiensis]SDY87460.1 oxygen-independent coproporphyrinogen-3 oxidase [Tindallia californiensis]
MKLLIIVEKTSEVHELREMTRLFLSDQDFKVIQKSEEKEKVFSAEIKVCIRTRYDENNTKIMIEITGKAKENKTITFKTETDLIKQKKNEKNKLKRMIYDRLQLWFPTNLSWGMLTGVRPVKIAHEKLRRFTSKEYAIKMIMEETMMKKEKATLITEMATLQNEYVLPVKEDNISLYINFPICPSKCSYCSFASQSLKSKEDPIVDKYLEGLFKEMEILLMGLKQRNKEIQSLYIGGGTPSVLSCSQLEGFLNKLNTLWDLKKINEITFEGGRPDTLDDDKLKLLADYPIHRISINPQTLHDQTLQRINRHHSVQDFFNVYESAIRFGHQNINVDVIMGLPGETPDKFLDTLYLLKPLELESLTVHALAMKKNAGLRQRNYQFEWVDEAARNVMEQVYHFAVIEKLEPYYLYRQKQMLANMENVGFAKKGKASIYNILMMEEIQTVLGIGAGAVSKLIFPKENRVQRVPGIKDILVYLNRLHLQREKWEQILDQL